MKSAVALNSLLAALLLAACTPAPIPAQPPVQRERLAYLKRTASEPVTCSIGADCTEKWARAQQWVLKHSSYSIKSSTDSKIVTYGPIDPTTDSAFTVTQIQQDANTNRIDLTSTCGKTPICSPTTLELKSGFNHFVMYGN